MSASLIEDSIEWIQWTRRKFLEERKNEWACLSDTTILKEKIIFQREISIWHDLTIALLCVFEWRQHSMCIESESFEQMYCSRMRKRLSIEQCINANRGVKWHASIQQNISNIGWCIERFYRKWYFVTESNIFKNAKYFSEWGRSTTDFGPLT